MAEYLERTKAIQQMADNFRQASVDGCDNQFYQVAEETLATLPAENVAPIVKATILGNEMDEWWCAFGKCSNCGEKIPTFSKFCLECGARLDGDC